MTIYAATASGRLLHARSTGSIYAVTQCGKEWSRVMDAASAYDGLLHGLYDGMCARCARYHAAPTYADRTEALKMRAESAELDARIDAEETVTADVAPAMVKCADCAGYGYRRDFEYNDCDASSECGQSIRACEHHACYICAGTGRAPAHPADCPECARPARMPHSYVPAEYWDEYDIAQLDARVAVDVTRAEFGKRFSAEVPAYVPTIADAHRARVALRGILPGAEFEALTEAQTVALVADLLDMVITLGGIPDVDTVHSAALSLVENCNSGIAGYMSRYADCLLAHMSR